MLCSSTSVAEARTRRRAGVGKALKVAGPPTIMNQSGKPRDPIIDGSATHSCPAHGALRGQHTRRAVFAKLTKG